MEKESKTDWERIEAMRDEDIDLTESPELDDTFFKEAVASPAQERQITLRLDPGTGRTAINKVLRRYVDTQKQH